jgi:hypothetical protein
MVDREDDNGYVGSTGFGMGVLSNLLEVRLLAGHKNCKVHVIDPKSEYRIPVKSKKGDFFNDLF